MSDAPMQEAAGDQPTLPVASERRALVVDLEARRRELTAATRDLRAAAARWVDPREYVRAAPLGWLAGAAVVGFWLGRRTPPR